MKCRYIVDIIEPRKQFYNHEGVKRREDGRYVWPAGTVEDHPNAYLRVRMGDSEPADDECRLAAAMSSQEMKTAQRISGAVRAGIEPVDYQRFFDGENLGYDSEGEDVPGPNYVPPEDDDDDDDD